MSRINKRVAVSRQQLQWYISGAVVLVGALLLFAYISFVQASAAFIDDGTSLETFQRAFAGRLIKVLMLVLTLGLFLFFFKTQDYRMTFCNLLERLSFRQPTSLDNETAFEQADGAGIAASTQNEFSNDLLLIESSVDFVLKENQDYRNRLDIQRAQQRNDYLLRLMKGWINDTPVTRRVFSSFGYDLQNVDHILVVTSISSSEDTSHVQETSISMAYLIMQQLLGQMLEQLLKVHAITVEGKLALLIIPEASENLNNKQTLSDLVTAIKLSQQLVFDETRITLQSALGSIGRGLPSVHQSFSQAIDSFEYAQLIGNGCAVALDHNSAKQEEDEQISSAWSKLEHQLLNCIDVEEYGRAQELFNKMLDSGYISRAPTLALARHRMLNVTDLLVNILDKTSSAVSWDGEELQTVKNKLLSCKSLYKLQRTSTELFAALNYLSSAKRRKSSYLRIMDIIDHVEKNYTDANLCVNQIAASFELNPSYLSRNFKKLMCIGLSDYIRRLRVAKAKDLLNMSDMSVKHAAEMVGFSNVLTMNRAFRKEEGTTAGRLRKPLPESSPSDSQLTKP